MDRFIYLVILIGALIYKLWWRPKVCKEKISDKIKTMGGQVMNIEQISFREEIYNVLYTVNGKSQKVVVIFNLMYKQKWK